MINGVQSKHQIWQQRIERNIHAQIAKLDRDTLGNIYHVSEFCDDIQRHMQATEHLTQPDSCYINLQQEIDEKIRSVLVDWIISVHAKFKLWPDTLYLTINLIDRYLGKF